jgi:hypothetical protein
MEQGFQALYPDFDPVSGLHYSLNIVSGQSQLRLIKKYKNKYEFASCMEDVERLKIELKNSFDRIKSDMAKKDIEIEFLKKEIEKLKKELVKKPKQQSNKGLEKDLLNKYEKNKKIILKNNILNEILSKELTKSQLKQIIVEEKNYCSKASLYRYLEELEREKKINTVIINRKAVIVPSKIPRYSFQ